MQNSMLTPKPSPLHWHNCTAYNQAQSPQWHVKPVKPAHNGPIQLPDTVTGSNSRAHAHARLMRLKDSPRAHGYP